MEKIVTETYSQGRYVVSDDGYLELYGNLSDSELLSRAMMTTSYSRKYREAAKRRNLL